MKRLVPPLILVAYFALGGYLLFQMAEQEAVPEYAIINVSGDQWEEWLDDGTLENLGGGAKNVLLRIDTDKPVRLHKKISSKGNVYIISPKGLIVGDDAFIDVYEQNTVSAPPAAFDLVVPESSSSGYELISQGNVYALAIEDDGKIRASKPLKLQKSE